MFEDQNTLQPGTLTSCSGTPPTTNTLPFPDSLVEAIVSKGQRVAILFSFTLSHPELFCILQLLV